MLLLATATAAAAGIGAGAAPALASAPAAAGSTLTVTYPVNGSTFINKVNSTVTLGPGKLVATANLTTLALTANLSLPPATGTFTEFGFIPVTATTRLIQDGKVTGKLSPTGNSVTTTATETLQLTALNIGGLPVPVGNACETSPTRITVASQPGFNVLKGGTLTGTYTIPPFAHCGLATVLINLTLPGPGNTISLTLGQAKLGG